MFASQLDGPRPDGLPNYTVDALKALRKEQPDASLFGIVGLDAFLTLRQWREPQLLLDLAEWIVVSRPGSAFDRLAELRLSAAQRPRVHPLEGVDVPVSATGLRARLAAGETCAGLIPRSVLDYIQEHGLYPAVQ